MMRVRALIAAAGLAAAGALLALTPAPGAALADSGWNLVVGGGDGAESGAEPVTLMDSGWN